jgi:pyruvate,water dikinase
MAEKEVYWLEEIGQEYEGLVGKKGANLGEALKIGGVRVPPGFVISINAYERFAKETGVEREIGEYFKRAFTEGSSFTDFSLLQQVSLKARGIIESHKMPPDLEGNISAHYKSLSDKCLEPSAAVSVRSAGVKSHPGQYETYLNVRGTQQVLDKVVKVWSSIYNVRSLGAAMRESIQAEQCPLIGVCVLKMVDARAAGVCLTTHPTSGDDTKALVEANWGLGESVVSGAATPDSFIVNKKEMRVVEKRIGDKAKRVVMGDEGGIREEDVSNDQDKFSITDEEAIGIVALAMKLESHFGVPQDVEWSVDDSLDSGENIFLLQARPQVGIPEKKSATDKITDIMLKRFREI